MRKDISVVIQGPLDDRTYQAIDQYQDFGEVIVSTWEDSDLTLLDKARGYYSLVVSKYPKCKKVNCWQAMSTQAGAEIASCEYVMKTRSDELYPDLDAMIHNLTKHPYRSHTTNNGFWRKYPHCYSCHLFIDKRTFVHGAMKSLAESYLAGKPLKMTAAESEFGYFLMRERGVTLTDKNWKDHFRTHVYITPCEELKGHLHSGATTEHGGFKRSSEPYPKGRAEATKGKHPQKDLYYSHEDIV